MTQQVALYRQCRDANHLYCFKSKGDRVTLKIFFGAREDHIKIKSSTPAPVEWSKIESAKTLLDLFYQNGLIPLQFRPSSPVTDIEPPFESYLVDISDAIASQDWETAERIGKEAERFYMRQIGQGKRKHSQNKEYLPLLLAFEKIYTHVNQAALCSVLMEIGATYLNTDRPDLAEKTFRKAYQQFQLPHIVLSISKALSKQEKIPESVQALYEGIMLVSIQKAPEEHRTLVEEVRRIDPALVHLTPEQKTQFKDQRQMALLHQRNRQATGGDGQRALERFYESGNPRR